MHQQHPINFRDVSDALGLWLDEVPFPLGRLIRGGKFDTMSTLADLGFPKTIINLRQGPDPQQLGATLVHLPATDSVENYDTSHSKVRRWIATALEVFVDPATQWPIYIHCTSGRDRTGVVVAATLLLIGIPREIVIEEFLLSSDAERESVLKAIDGLCNRSCDPLVDPHTLKQALFGVQLDV
ncbi:MAG: tyrosine-protein phosphatase [Undibacterium umbellatum]|uniref:tyrosine-protein phosphatase n=1 Tax=Undibacterium umbellatum TaxID=2762300 RepID=UPI003BB61541